MHLHLPNPERLSASTRTAREAFWLTIICVVAGTRHATRTPATRG